MAQRHHDDPTGRALTEGLAGSRPEPGTGSAPGTPATGAGGARRVSPSRRTADAARGSGLPASGPARGRTGSAVRIDSAHRADDALHGPRNEAPARGTVGDTGVPGGRERSDVVTGGSSDGRGDGPALASTHPNASTVAGAGTGAAAGIPDTAATSTGAGAASSTADTPSTATSRTLSTDAGARVGTATLTPATGELLAAYLRAQATEFLRALRLHRETGAGAAPAADSLDAARALRRSARRISGSLHTFRPLLDADWSEQIRPELAWLSGTLALEHSCEARLERLLHALHRLSGAPVLPEQQASSARKPATADDAPERGTLTVGAAKAGALLDRQLTLARTRAHSTALQALGSSRFHAVADKIALLASEVPLTATATAAPLAPLADAAEERLTAAIAGLPLLTAGSPYNAEALIHGLSPDPAPHPQDTPWHQVRLLLRLHRYALEVLNGGACPDDVRLQLSGEALDRHRDASEAAAAAASAARTPRIAPATAYALGVLHADQRHEVEAARYAFQQSWQARALTPSS